MKKPRDNIRVGSVTLEYSVEKAGWICPGQRVITNPITAQHLAERLNKQRRGNDN